MPANSAGSHSYREGFSLVELMVVVCISIIFAGLALPSFANLIQQVRLIAIAHELRSTIQLTRAEAIKRNGYVDLTAVNGNWENGWRMKSAENDQILIHAPIHKNFKIEAKFTDGVQHIAYNGTGHSRVAKNSQAALSGHILISIGAHTRLIVVNFLGNVRICNPASDKSCISNSLD